MNYAMCMIKPDGMKHSQFIITYLEQHQIKITQSKNKILSANDVDVLYAPIAQTMPLAMKQAHQSLDGKKVVLMKVEAKNSNIYRKLRAIKERLRSQLAEENPKGILHTSEHAEEAAREIIHFFICP